MTDLIAQGPNAQDRWRRKLRVGQACVVGRAAPSWPAPWDDHISRRHVSICWQDNRLEVERLQDARNPVFFGGREVEKCFLKAGQHFVIGGTTFTVTDERVAVTIDAPDPVTEQSYSQEYLKRMRFRHADQRIAVLGQLPEIISGASTDEELCLRLVNVLLAGIARANAAAIVAVRPNGEEMSKLDVLHWDRRLVSGRDFQPSAKLIRQAVESGESVVHVWSDASEGSRSSFTVAEDVDWAFSTPVIGDACRGWSIYIAGNYAGDHGPGSNVTDPSDLRDDLKFAELAATTLGSLRDVRMLERRQTSLGQFFSPVVMAAIGDKDPDDVLAPRETEVSVLFCDLRGFSRTSERMADDLLGLLERVSQALGLTTSHILEQGGVVGDFHGDAAMGFWGWPLEQEDAPRRACLAALGMRAELEAAAKQEDHPLANFRMGIGIATGRAVAGKIGTVDQVKVTVFGPVVNVASRLETMTNQIRTPILIDDATAKAIRESTSLDVARVRRVAVVRPVGMEHSLEVSELLPPASEFPLLQDAHITAYEAALEALLERDWEAAFQKLHEVPAEDRVKDFLTVFIAQHNRTAPANWDGVIPLLQK